MSAIEKFSTKWSDYRHHNECHQISIKLFFIRIPFISFAMCAIAICIRVEVEDIPICRDYAVDGAAWAGHNLQQLSA